MQRKIGIQCNRISYSWQRSDYDDAIDDSVGVDVLFFFLCLYVSLDSQDQDLL